MIESFGVVLARYRIRRKVSQANLGRLIDSDHSYVSRLESEQRNPSRSIVERIVDALDLPMEEEATLMHAAGFTAGGEFLVHHEILMEIDQLMRRPDMSPAMLSAAHAWLETMKSALVVARDNHV